MNPITELADRCVLRGVRSIDALTEAEKTEMTSTLLMTCTGEEIMRDAAGSLVMCIRAAHALSERDTAAVRNFARELLSRVETVAEQFIEDELSNAMARADISTTDVEFALDSRDRARDMNSALI